MQEFSEQDGRPDGHEVVLRGDDLYQCLKDTGADQRRQDQSDVVLYQVRSAKQTQSTGCRALLSEALKNNFRLQLDLIIGC